MNGMPLGASPWPRPRWTCDRSSPGGGMDTWLRPTVMGQPRSWSLFPEPCDGVRRGWACSASARIPAHKIKNSLRGTWADERARRAVLSDARKACTWQALSPPPASALSRQRRGVSSDRRRSRNNGGVRPTHLAATGAADWRFPGATSAGARPAKTRLAMLALGRRGAVLPRASRAERSHSSRPLVLWPGGDVASPGCPTRLQF